MFEVLHGLRQPDELAKLGTCMLTLEQNQPSFIAAYFPIKTVGYRETFPNYLGFTLHCGVLHVLMQGSNPYCLDHI